VSLPSTLLLNAGDYVRVSFRSFSSLFGIPTPWQPDPNALAKAVDDNAATKTAVFPVSPYTTPAGSFVSGYVWTQDFRVHSTNAQGAAVHVTVQDLVNQLEDLGSGLHVVTMNGITANDLSAGTAPAERQQASSDAGKKTNPFGFLDSLTAALSNIKVVLVLVLAVVALYLVWPAASMARRLEKKRLAAKGKG